MKLKEIIQVWPNSYDGKIEANIIAIIRSTKFDGLTHELADLLALSISDHYNNLAKMIIEREYNGSKIILANLNQSLINRSEEKYSLLHFAAQFGNKEMLIYFLHNGVEISLDKDQMTPLHSLAFALNLTKQDILEIISEFKKTSPDIINQKDIFNFSPLYYATSNKNSAAIDAFIANGANS